LTSSMSHSEDLEVYLQSNARDGVQALLNALFLLPSTPSPDGPVAKLPPPVTQLPRAKPLPKPKPLTKWEKFAKEKGISHRKKEKAVWDEEKQEWANRWGWKGKNKELEDRWLTEVPSNAGMFSLSKYIQKIPNAKTRQTSIMIPLKLLKRTEKHGWSRMSDRCRKISRVPKGGTQLLNFHRGSNGRRRSTGHSLLLVLAPPAWVNSTRL
jgi:hypothetical protein